MARILHNSCIITPLVPLRPGLVMLVLIVFLLAATGPTNVEGRLINALEEEEEAPTNNVLEKAEPKLLDSDDDSVDTSRAPSFFPSFLSNETFVPIPSQVPSDVSSSIPSQVPTLTNSSVTSVAPTTANATGSLPPSTVPSAFPSAHAVPSVPTPFPSPAVSQPPSRERPAPTKVPAPPAPTPLPTNDPSVEPSQAPAADRGRSFSFWRMLGRTVAWLILLVLAWLGFGVVMSNRYQIYYFLRGCWYTFLQSQAVQWLVHKVRSLLSGDGSSSSANNLNTIVFDNDLSEGLLLQETDG